MPDGIVKAQEEKNDRRASFHMSKFDIVKQDIQLHIDMLSNDLLSKHLADEVKNAKLAVLKAARDFLNGICKEHDLCSAIINNPNYSKSTGRSYTKKLVKAALEVKNPEIAANSGVLTLLKDISAQRRKITFAFFGSDEIKLAKLHALQKCSDALCAYDVGSENAAIALVDEAENIPGFSKGMFWSNTFTLVSRAGELVRPKNLLLPDV